MLNNDIYDKLKELEQWLIDSEELEKESMYRIKELMKDVFEEMDDMRQQLSTTIVGANKAVEEIRRELDTLTVLNEIQK